MERVHQTICRYGMFAPEQRVGVAVSGGADSVCLLEVLAELAPRWELRLEVLHLDHQLRGQDSAEDAGFVRKLAARRGLELHLRQVSVRQLSQARGDNLEQTARRARREFFLEFLREGRLDRVALGHTRSDQAETVLFRLLRGAWTAGLAGIRPVTPEGLVRPLIEVDRREVLEYLKERGIPWREDSSNLDRKFARNRIRHELLPALVRDWNPALAEILAQTAVLAQEDEEYWNREMDRLAGEYLHLTGGSVVVEAGALRRLPKAVARRLARRAIELARGDLLGVDFVHVEQLMRLAERTAGHGRAQVPGLDVVRSFEWIRLSPKGVAEQADFRIALAVPGQYAVPGTDLRIILELGEAESRYNTEGSGLDWGRAAGPLELRNFRPGDRYRPAGHASQVKIKRLFQEARVPLWARRKWPIITCRDTILWVAKFGSAAGWAAGPASRTVLKIQETGDFAVIWTPRSPVRAS